MRGNSRMPRVNELLKREIAEQIEKNIELGNCLVSVTEVDVAPGLRNAKVFISILGPKDSSEKQKILNKIENLRGLIQEQMSKKVILKYTPVLHFKLDNRVETGDRVLSILQELEEEEK
ncbi:MAG: 30S ribosome-binding factor RbfA [Victivallales bacterium]|nr:30S ribosome-binding factor RbfA [Victivallales bacterium]MCF7888920.1 30S ribosome-binding factor RbfA [Victivallales bacterium]